MWFWAFMLIMLLIVPISMIGFGRFFMKGGPKEVNAVFGYRTSRSMKNRDTWDFAHRYAGKIWFVCGCAMIPLVVILLLLVFDKDEDVIGNVGLILTAIQIAVLTGTIFPVERMLKKTFDDDGKRRSADPVGETGHEE